jgi:hypothetical protein
MTGQFSAPQRPPGLFMNGQPTPTGLRSSVFQKIFRWRAITTATALTTSQFSVHQAAFGRRL